MNQEYWTISTNKDIIILPSDNGNARVVMATSKYSEEMIEILKNPAYKRRRGIRTHNLKKNNQQITTGSCHKPTTDLKEEMK